MNINPLELKKFIEENPKLVSRKQSKRHPELFVLKYTNKVFYDNLWHLSPLLLECRGLVVDEYYNVVIKPFTKVFNHHENGTDINSGELCTAVRKVNGFLGVATYAPHITEDIIYSTTGSLDSDFVALAEKHISPYANKMKAFGPGTYMYEVCDLTDPHIIPEDEGAWLIGSTAVDEDKAFPGKENQEWALTILARVWDIKRPEVKYNVPFSSVVQMAKECKHEGFMVYGMESGKALKIKSPYYLVTKFLARANDKKLMEGVLNGDKTRIDEEYYPLVDFLTANKEQFVALEEQQRIAVIREFLEK